MNSPSGMPGRVLYTWDIPGEAQLSHRQLQETHPRLKSPQCLGTLLSPTPPHSQLFQ